MINITSILISCGWNPIIQTKSPFTTNCVLCLSHTGIHEFFLWLLYIKIMKISHVPVICY